MTILDNNMDSKKAIQIVTSALLRSKRAIIHPWVWLYSNEDGSETVEFIMGKAESKYIYTRFKKFLGFKFGLERFTLSSNDLDLSDWHAIGDVVNNVNVRHGYNG